MKAVGADEVRLHEALASEGFAYAESVERALEEILAGRFREAFRCSGERRLRLTSPRGTRGIVANDERTAMLVKLDYEATHPPAEDVEVRPEFVEGALRVFTGSRVRFLKLSGLPEDGAAPLLIQQAGSSFGVLVAPIVRESPEAA